MGSDDDLHVLFATDGSAACARAAAALRQLGSSREVTTTLVHVLSPGQSLEQGRRVLASLQPALEPTHRCRRLLLDGPDPAASIADACGPGGFDVVLAPGADRSIGRLWSRSVRARLVRECTVPLWTMGPRVSPQRFAGPLRRVACLVDFDDAPVPRLAVAARLAETVGARLLALCVVQPLHDGTHVELLGSSAPLTAAEARERLDAVVSRWPGTVVCVSEGRRGPTLRHMLDASDADLLVVGRRSIASGVSARWCLHDLDRLPTPVVAVDPLETGLSVRPFRRQWSPLLHCVGGSNAFDPIGTPAPA